MDDLSPRYQMKLIQKIENKLQDEFTDIQDISYYIEKWHQSWDGNSFGSEENFHIYVRSGNINLGSCLD